MSDNFFGVDHDPLQNPLNQPDLPPTEAAPATTAESTEPAATPTADEILKVADSIAPPRQADYDWETRARELEGFIQQARPTLEAVQQVMQAPPPQAPASPQQTQERPAFLDDPEANLNARDAALRQSIEATVAPVAQSIAQQQEQQRLQQEHQARQQQLEQEHNRRVGILNEQTTAYERTPVGGGFTERLQQHHQSLVQRELSDPFVARKAQANNVTVDRYAQAIATQEILKLSDDALHYGIAAPAYIDTRIRGVGQSPAQANSQAQPVVQQEQPTPLDGSLSQGGNSQPPPSPDLVSGLMNAAQNGEMTADRLQEVLLQQAGGNPHLAKANFDRMMAGMDDLGL